MSAPKAILILQLDHEDGSILVNHHRQYFSCKRFKIATVGKDVVGVITLTHVNYLLAEQIRWKATKVELSAYIRTRTNDNIHVILLTELEEARKIILRRRKIKRTICLFMLIPKDVDGYGV